MHPAHMSTCCVTNLGGSLLRLVCLRLCLLLRLLRLLLHLRLLLLLLLPVPPLLRVRPVV